MPSFTAYVRQSVSCTSHKKQSSVKGQMVLQSDNYTHPSDLSDITRSDNTCNNHAGPNRRHMSF